MEVKISIAVYIPPLNVLPNLGRNICRLFHVLAKFLFITCKTELDYYHQKVNLRVALQFAERLKTSDLKKLGNFKGITETL